MVQAKHRAGWNITEAEWQAKKPGLIAQLKARAHVQKAALAPMGDQPEQLKRISEREAMAGRRAKTAEALRTMRADITAAKAAKTPEHFAAHAKPGDVGHIPLEHLHRDEPRFQYKQEGIGKKGVTDQFKDVKVWNPHLGGTIQGWRDPADGKVYVVNGHHRLELAERLGVKHVKVELLDATDAAHARAIGAIQNIGEGRGTVRDAATFLHEHGIRDRSELEKHGLSLSEHVTNRGISLASLHPNLYREYKAGNLPEERGAIIGGSGLDHEQQHSLVKSLKPGTSNSKLQEYIDNAREAPKAKQVTHSLFGTHEDEVSLAHHRVDVQDHIKRQLMGDQKLFGLVSKGKAAEALAERGQSHIDVEKTGEISLVAAAVLSAFHTLKNRSGPVARALNDAAEQLHRGEPRERVYKEARERVREEVARMLQGGKESFAA
jgi:ParB-like chromosome segregation protein Spo0J